MDSSRPRRSTALVCSCVLVTTFVGRPAEALQPITALLGGLGAQAPERRRRPGEVSDVPSPGLRLVGAGHGRTGTESIWVALKILGYKAAHGEVFHGDCGVHYNATAEKIWADWEARGGDFGPALQTLLERGYDATVGDDPFAASWHELHRRYPDAPVLLSVHPKGVAGWLRSQERLMNQTFFDSHRDEFARANVSEAEARTLLGVVLNDFTMSGWAYAYEAYNEHVRKVVPPNKLLVYNVSQGWGPLCDFLGVPVPKLPFPHVDVYGEGCKPLMGQDKYRKYVEKLVREAGGVGNLLQVLRRP